MGYTTDFSGSVTIDPPLNEHETSFLTDFNETRRMMRTKGPLFVKGSGFHGQGSDDDIVSYNTANGERGYGFEDWPAAHQNLFEENGQPGLWCQWTPTEDGSAIEWDGGEKFYHSAEWMKYIITKLLHGQAAREYVTARLDQDDRLQHFTFDHVVNGTIEASGEDPDDRWALVVRDSVVQVAEGTFGYAEPKAV